MQVPKAFLEGVRGDLRGLPALEEDAAWGATARALRAFMEELPPPSVDQITATDDAEARAWGHALLLLRRALELDRVGMAVVVDALGDTPRDAATRLSAEALDALLDDDPARLTSSAESLGALARAESLGAELVLATLLGGLAHMLGGDDLEALARTRRAARMAQAEHLWLPRFLVSVFLARLRRRTGHPHLAGLIATSCREVAPRAMAGWLRWEQVLAGVEVEPDDFDDPMSQAAADLLARLRGDVRGAPPAMPALFAVDRAAALGPLGVATDPVPPAVEAWMRGEVADAPAAIRGLGQPAWQRADDEPVVLARPGEMPVRRYAYAPGLPAALPPVGARPGRPEALAAQLTLAGEAGATRPALFEAVYGFAYRRRLHEASFKVVRHQTKKLLAPVADIHTEGERVWLTVRAPYCVPDPRCRRPLHERLLRLLGARAGASAKELASGLDVPLRTVQLALRELHDDGVCVVEKDGRRVSYNVEDTTFCQITIV